MLEMRSHKFFFGVVLGAYGLYIVTAAVNVPWFDDIDAFVDAFLIFHEAPSWGAKLAELIAPNNEHRMWLGKTVSIGLTYLMGEMDFRYLIWLQNLVLFGLVALFHRFHRHHAWTLLWSLFVLTPQYHLSSNWAITGWQHIGVLFMGVLTVWFLVQPKRWLWALPLMVLTIFTMSNGMLFWAAGIFLLGFQGKWRELVAWLFVGIFGIWAYFYGFDTTANSNAFAYFKANPVRSMSSFFVFLGNNGDWFKYVSLETRSLIAGVWGFVFLGWVLWNGWRLFIHVSPSKFSTGLWALLGVLLFLLGNGLLIGVLRAQFGYEVMLVGNYRIYSAFFLGSAVLWHVWIQSLLHRSSHMPVLLGLGIVFWVLSYVISWPEIKHRQRSLLAAGYNQQHQGIGLAAQRGSFLMPYIQEKMEGLQAIDRFTYPTYFPELLVQRLPMQPAKQDLMFSQDGPILQHEPIQAAEAIFVVFSRGEERYILPMERIWRQGRWGLPQQDPRYQLIIPPLFFEKDQYQVSFLYQKSNNFTPIHSSHSVNITF